MGCDLASFHPSNRNINHGRSHNEGDQERTHLQVWRVEAMLRGRKRQLPEPAVTVERYQQNYPNLLSLLACHC